MADDRFLVAAEKLQGQLRELSFMVNYPILVEAIKLLRQASDARSYYETRMANREAYIEELETQLGSARRVL